MAVTIGSALAGRVKQIGLREQDIYSQDYQVTDNGSHVVAKVVFCIPPKAVANVVAELHEAGLRFQLVSADGNEGREALVHRDDKERYAYLLSVDFTLPVVVPERT